MTTAIPAVDVDPREGKAAQKQRKQKPNPIAELSRMREAMASENGLFNAAQAALFLDVSRERIYELMELGMLKKYEFLGRIYLSCKELDGRRDADIKAGRPLRSTAQKVKVAMKTVMATDLAQWAQEPFGDAQKLVKKAKAIIKPGKKK